MYVTVARVEQEDAGVRRGFSAAAPGLVARRVSAVLWQSRVWHLCPCSWQRTLQELPAGGGFGDGAGASLVPLGSQLTAVTQLRSCLLQPDNNPGQVCCLWLQGSALEVHFERELQELLTS